MTPHLTVSFCSFAFSILLLCPFMHLAGGATINFPKTSFLASNQSSPLSKNLSLTRNLGSSTYQCTDNPVWNSPAWHPSDCQVALLRLALTESDRHGDHYFEFLGPGATASHRLPTMDTPRRYTSGKLDHCSWDLRFS